MASRMFQRRIGSLFFRNQPSLAHALKEQHVPSAYSVFSRYELGKRDIQTEPKLASLTDMDPREENHKASSLEPSGDKEQHPNGVDFNINAEYLSKTSPRHDLCMVFTCKVCNIRSVKMASRESYERGVVVARCGGCNNYHLIADHLGIFGDKFTVENFLAARGEEVTKGSTDTLNLTVEDLAGMKPKDEAEKGSSISQIL